MDAPPRPHRHAALALLALFVSLSIGTAHAGLYGPEAPVDAAWVRVVNVGADGGIAVQIADGSAQVLALHHATRYTLVDPGPVRVDVGGDVQTVEVGPESFTTVVATGDGTVVVADPALRDISRGLLGLLNLTDRAALDLAVPDGAVVVGGVPPGAHEAIAVAEATTELAVVEDGVELARLEARTVERGVAYVVVVVDTAEGVVAFVLTAAGE